MKRRKLLSMLLTVAMAISLIPATIMADDEKPEIEVEDTYSIEGTVSLDDTTDNSDELFAGFVNRQFGIEDGSSAPATRGAKTRGAVRAGDSLTGIEKKIYDSISAEIGNVASGARTSTKFDVPLDAYHFTAAEFGESMLTQTAYEKAVQAVMNSVTYDMTPVLQALIKDFPFDMFWCSKRAGYGWKAFDYDSVYPYEEFDIKPTLVILLYIYPAYQSAEDFVLTSDIQTVTAAANRAQLVVEEYKELTDREKLAAYKQWICDATSYNDAAAEAGGVNAFGNSNPWQLIWVFDDDPDTEVVCEGYAKAFKYLCDQSSFNDPNIDCYIVSGVMAGGTGEGPHMWNMVTLEDGKHYLVDVTNCDGVPNGTQNSIGYPDKLFLRTYDEKKAVTKTNNGTSYDTTLYTYYINASNQISYWYSQDTEYLYPAELLAVADFAGQYDTLDVTFRHSCTFDSSLAINYYVETSELSGYSDIKLVMKKYGDTIEIPAKRKNVSGTTYYWFQYTGVAAHEMGMQLTAELHATKGGEEYASAIDHYSVKTYAYNLLNKNGYSNKFYRLLVDMLNYGATAQQFKYGSSAGELVNADLTSGQNSLATQSNPALPQNGTTYTGNYSDTVQFTGLSLVLESNFTLKFYMDIAASQSTSNLQLKCTYTNSYGEEITKIIPYSEFGNSSNGIVASLDSIAAADARCLITARVFDGDVAVSGAFTTSVAGYSQGLINQNAAKYTNLVYSMMKYCDSAHAYFNE
ncbi:MAG: hypothetical protein IK020_02080 [Clostridiales bacterium]|nr:hypothetical protein [Clostridiales bacterium]